MTKAERIKQLETELKLERMEHDQTRSKLDEYRRKEECYVVAHQEGAVVDPAHGYSTSIVVRHCPAHYGAGNFDFRAFDGALRQFLAKWNELAVRQCEKSEYGKQLEKCAQERRRKGAK